MTSFYQYMNMSKINNFGKYIHSSEMVVFDIYHYLLLTMLLIMFCILHNNSEAEAAAATLLTKIQSILHSRIRTNDSPTLNVIFL